MNTLSLQRLGAALALGLAGYVHFKIWQNEYRHAPVREMFVANWVASGLVVILLIVVAVLPRLPKRYARIAALAGLLVALGSLVAFGLSRGPGLPTLHGNFKEHGLETTASYFFHVGSAKTILVAETIAAILCGGLIVQQERLAG